MNKLNVCVVFGGKSSEHEVSRLSATNIISNLNTEKYNVYMLGITKKGEWLLYDGEIDKLSSDEWEKDNVKKAIISPDTTDSGLIVFDNDKISKIHLDCVIVIIHGKNGEDGTIQGLLELSGIPYTGSGVLGSAVCMDKGLAKEVLEYNGIPVTKGISLRKHSGIESAIKAVKETFEYPVFVKPANAGSSVGCSKATNDDELENALKIAFENDKKILVEEFIDAIEVESAVMGNDEPKVAKVGQIVTYHDFYDYDAKYNDKTSRTVIPAEIPQEKADEIAEIAKKAYICTECYGFARIDFFIDKKTGKIILNEINTLPGFTNISMFPMMWKASGLSYSEILDEIIRLGLEAKNG